MTNECRIEPASLKYADGFWKTLDAVARERSYLLFTEGPDPEQTRQFVADIVDKGWTQFYALMGDEVVGWCDIIPGQREGLLHAGQLGMGVLAKYRGQGIGTALLTTTIAAAFDQGIVRIELETFSTNDSAIRLYEKLGFQVEGRKRKARYIDGDFQDFIVMALLNE